MNLRPYQSDLLDRADAAFRDARRVLLQLPTGGGKTVLFSRAAQDEPGRVAIVAHRRELIRQAHRRTPGSAIYPSADPQRITVGSIQTFARRLDALPRFDLIVLDEAHHAVAGQYERLLASQPGARVLGVTATPERLDGRGLGTVFERLICGPSVAQLTADGYLCPARVYGPPAPPDLSRVRTTAGDFNAADLEQIMAAPSLLGSAPEHYERLAAGRSALVFCISVRHAEESAAAFRAEGWRFVCVHGGMTTDARDAALADLAAGRLHGLTSCELISEGLDIPDVGCVIMQRPTQSLGMYLQQVGRGLRPAPGKPDLVVLDHAGNVLRHGLPDADRAWSLDATKRRGAGVAVAQCPSCYAMHPPGPRCPACGHSYEAARAEAERRELERLDGELALLTAEDRRLRMLRETPLATLLKAARTHAELEEIGTARGFHPGWADIRSRFLPRTGAASDGAEFMA